MTVERPRAAVPAREDEDKTTEATWAAAKKVWKKSGSTAVDKAMPKEMGKAGWDKGHFGKPWAASDKATMESAISIDKLARGAGSVKDKNEPKMEQIEDLWKERQRALKSGMGHKASKGEEVAKEAWASAVGQGATKS